MSTLGGLIMVVVVVGLQLLFLYGVIWFITYMLGAIGVYEYTGSVRQLVWLLIAISIVYSALFKVKW